MLNPAMVAAHFLLSAAILAVAVILRARAGEKPGPVRLVVRADLRVLAALLVAGTTLMLAAGTVVTGSGPLAGTVIDSGGHRTTVPRFHLPLVGVTQLHGLVWVHVAVAVIPWILVLRLYLSTSPRGSLGATPAQETVQPDRADAS
jgi:cytochrome c oxidase assembly protein subunit 15